ncbi:MAG: hypothetical protein KDD66_15595 [Bdellovibrionales bacterium]|nr:hypothetical protein [Bdellovibrionales bacterium]
MSSTIYVSIALVVAGGMATGAILVASKYLRGNLTKAAQADIDATKAKVAKIDRALEAAFSVIETMVPYDDVLSQQKEISGFEERLAKEKEALGKLEGSLAQSQDEVDQKESKHNELKMGRENSAKIADELKANRDRLIDETEALESQVSDAQTHLASLKGSTNLTKDQKAGVEEIASGLEKSKNHLSELKEVFEQASNRFVNLQAQYSQLELEYRNLVEKQLSGEA